MYGTKVAGLRGNILLKVFPLKIKWEAKTMVEMNLNVTASIPHEIRHSVPHRAGYVIDSDLEKTCRV
jgi:hypothetical protein